MDNSKEMGREAYQIKVTLRGSHPPIWRRVVVASDTTLHELHSVLQVVMGWTNTHLHRFRTRNIYYSGPKTGFGMYRKNEKKTVLSDAIRNPKDRLVYEYDFGDGWEHDIVLEKVEPAQVGDKYPMALAGKRASPPEDVGGIWGYYHFLEAIGDPSHPEHKDMVEWIGGNFDPAMFDINRINNYFHRGRRKKDA